MGKGEIRKAREKEQGSWVPLALLLSSIRSLFFSHPLCRRSPPSRSLQQASKTLKNKSSLSCASMFHGCITSSDMKYLPWHVPVMLILPINRCNFLLLPWKIAGKYDQSGGCCQQPAAILKPERLYNNQSTERNPETKSHINLEWKVLRDSLFPGDRSVHVISQDKTKLNCYNIITYCPEFIISFKVKALNWTISTNYCQRFLKSSKLSCNNCICSICYLQHVKSVQQQLSKYHE